MKKILFLFLFVFIFFATFIGKANAACGTAPSWSGVVGHTDHPTSVTYNLRVTNNCGNSTSYDLSVSKIPGTGWTWQYSGCSLNTTCRKTISAGGTLTVSVTIARPTGAKPGSYTIPLKATMAGTSISSTRNISYLVVATSPTPTNRPTATPTPTKKPTPTSVPLSYDCVSGVCSTRTGTGGQYATLGGCQAACKEPTQAPPTRTPTPLPTSVPVPTQPPLNPCGTAVLGGFAPDGVPAGGLCMLNKIISIFLKILFIAATVLATIFLIWGAIDWITSGGDKQKLERARHAITFAIIGLSVVFVSYFILNFIQKFFGIN